MVPGVPCGTERPAFVSNPQTESSNKMKTIFPIIRPLGLTLLLLANFAVSTRAQEVSIPDPGLEAAIRVALNLNKTNGPLTTQDLLGLRELNASSRDIS